MTPEEQFNREVWWLLQEIKKEYLATPKGEKVSFGLRFLPKSANYIDYGIPTPDTQAKLLKKFNKEFRILDDIESAGFNFDDFLSPPKGYLFLVRQPQFDKLYSEYEEKNALKEPQNLPTDKRVIDEDWTEKEVLEVVLLELSGAVSKHIGKNTCNVDITIAPLDKNIGNPKETTFRKKIISSLKSQGIIQDYNLRESNENIIFFDYSKNKNPEGRPVKMGVLSAECKVNPQKVIDYATEVFEPKKLYCEKLAELYTKLIDVIETYFTKPIIRDKKLNSFYTTLSGNIKEMIYEDLIPSLKLTNWQPFTNLFSAEEEMKKKGVNLKETIQIMNAFLGEIYKFTTIFDVKPKKKNETIKDLDSYLVSVKTQKKKQKKEPAPSKIEVVGLQDGLKAIAQTKKDNKNKFPYKLPAGTKWEDFIIQFLDEENVFIKVRQYKHNANYKEMGFIDKRFNTPQPNDGWVFLRILAKYNGEITIRDPDAKEEYKKQKEFVIKALQSYFGIEYDPFYPYEPYLPYKTEKSYKIKITLLPPPQTEKQTPFLNKDYGERELDDEIKEFYNEQTPQL